MVLESPGIVVKLSKAPESRANAYHALKMLTKGNSPLKKIRMSRSDVLDVQFIVSIIYHFLFNIFLIFCWACLAMIPFQFRATFIHKCS